MNNYKSRKSSIFEIQTAESAKISIFKEPQYDDYSDEEQFHYTIMETSGYGGYYWGFSHLHNEIDCINYLENAPNSYEPQRNNLSWWLNYRPLFLDDSIKPFLKLKMENYYATGEIKNAFNNSKNGLGGDSEHLIKWHKLLEVNFQNNFFKKENTLFSDLIRNDSRVLQNFKTISILFDGFQALPYHSISVKDNIFNNFQALLNYIFIHINTEVDAYSYGEKWLLYDTYKNVILSKESISDNPGWAQNLGGKLICYKK